MSRKPNTYTLAGKPVTVREVAEMTGLAPAQIHKRMYGGKTLDKIVSDALNPKKDPLDGLDSLMRRYPDEESAIRYFEDKRWPDGVTCPKCKSANVARGSNPSRSRQLWYCNGCKHMFSVTSGTVLDSIKTPLRKWMIAVHIMTNDPRIVTRKLKEILDVSHATAWHFQKRIRSATTESGFSLECDPLTKWKSKKRPEAESAIPRKGGSGYRTESKFSLFGQQVTMKELAQIAGVKPGAVWHRIRRGETPEQAIVPRNSRR